MAFLIMRDFVNTKEIIFHSLDYVSGNVLDLGAGSAKYKKIIEQKADKYLALDQVDGDNIDVVGDVSKTHFENASFDTVISTQVLEHVKRPWLMVEEIGRLLKKNGICILTAPFLTPYHADPNDYFRYTTEGLKSLFKNYGFEVLECEPYGRSFFVLVSFIKFIYFNPYKKEKKGSWKIYNLLLRISAFLNRFSKSRIIYSDVYIIVKKK